MKAPIRKQKIYASLLILGAAILLTRTIIMVVQGSLGILVPWVAALLIIELLLDLSCIVSAVPWLLKGEENLSSLPLRFGAAAALFHAFRVFIFVMGRLEPWMNFDVRVEHQALHAARWNWAQVWFAAIMSVLGIIGVIIIWRARAIKRRG